MRFAKYLFSEMAMQSIAATALFEKLHIIGLYKPSGMREFLRHAGDYDYLDGVILGALEFRDNQAYNVREVGSVAAEQGYGPVLYYIAMQTSPNGLTPNRTGQVTNEAKRIWKEFYDGIGSQDVIKTPLEGTDIEGGKITGNYPNESYMDMKYTLKQPKFNLDLPRKQNALILRNDPYGEKDIHMEEAFDGYLREKMDEIY